MNQKGFTLLEVLVALAVGGMVMTGIMLAIYQVAWGSTRANSQVTALTDVNQAAMWLRQDLQMAQSTTLADPTPTPQSSVTLDWTDYTGWATDNRTHASSYALSGTELRRTYDGAVRIVGRHITSIGFTRNGSVITVAITATGPGAQQQAETLELNVLTRMRPGAGG